MMKVCKLLTADFYPDTLYSSTYKTDHYDKIKTLLAVELNTNNTKLLIT